MRRRIIFTDTLRRVSVGEGRIYKEIEKYSTKDKTMKKIQKSLWGPETQTLIDSTREKGKQLVEHTQQIVAKFQKPRIEKLNQSAEEIIELFTSLGFTTADPVDYDKLRNNISEILSKNL